MESGVVPYFTSVTNGHDTCIHVSIQCNLVVKSQLTEPRSTSIFYLLCPEPLSKPRKIYTTNKDTTFLKSMLINFF